MKNITTLIGSLLILCGVYSSKVAAEGFTIGAHGIVGAVEASGTEHERTDAGDSQKTAHDAGAIFMGADIFAEYEFSNGLAIGYSMVPMDADIGSGKRTDTVQIADDNDTGDRSASAELTDLTTIYATKTLGGSNSYILLGYHQATVTTTETLPNSSYGDAGEDHSFYGSACSEGRGPGGGGNCGEQGLEAKVLRAVGEHCPTRSHIRLEHLLFANHGHGGDQCEAQAIRGSALLQSCADDEARGGYSYGPHGG